MTECTRDLLKLYPSMVHPIRCENGCGSVIELGQALRSYERDLNGDHKLICECCASEIGHVDEDIEEPEETPVCRKKPKKEGTS